MSTELFVLDNDNFMKLVKNIDDPAVSAMAILNLGCGCHIEDMLSMRFLLNFYYEDNCRAIAAPMLTRMPEGAEFEMYVNSQTNGERFVLTSTTLWQLAMGQYEPVLNARLDANYGAGAQLNEHTPFWFDNNNQPLTNETPEDIERATKHVNDVLLRASIKTWGESPAEIADFNTLRRCFAAGLISDIMADEQIYQYEGIQTHIDEYVVHNTGADIKSELPALCQIAAAQLNAPNVYTHRKQ